MLNKCLLSEWKKHSVSNVSAPWLLQLLSIEIPIQTGLNREKVWLTSFFKNQKRMSLPHGHNYCVSALEPLSCSYWVPAPRACAPQREKTLKREACVPQLESSPRPLQTEKATVQQWRPSATKNKINLFFFFFLKKECRAWLDLGAEKKKKRLLGVSFCFLSLFFTGLASLASSPLLDTWQLPTDPWFPSTSSAASRENHSSHSATRTVGRGRASRGGRDLSAGPVAETLHFWCRGTRFNPWPGN